MLNQVTLIGNLGKKPERRALPTGTAIAEFSVATSRWKKGKDGKGETETEWHNVVAYGKTAERCAEYLDKGRMVAVVGRLRTERWEKGGHKHNRTVVVADQVRFLGKKEPKAAEPAAPDEGGDAHEGGEVPF